MVLRCRLEVGVVVVEDELSDVRFEAGDGAVVEVEVEFEVRFKVGVVADPELIGVGAERDRTGAM